MITREKIFVILLSMLIASILSLVAIKYIYPNLRHKKTKKGDYWEVSYTTTKIGTGTNEVLGIVLHHTADSCIQESLFSLYKSELEVSCHAIIDKDGTRYILAEPTSITWHAGYSMFNGREKCNDFMIGIEFQGNTIENPLTQDQINSAIDYVIPIMSQYHIPLENIVTHQMIRKEWIDNHPQETIEKGVLEKTDITDEEYDRFLTAISLRFAM